MIAQAARQHGETLSEFVLENAYQVAAELRKDPDLKVNVVDGSKGEFSVEVDGRPVRAKSGESMRDPSELASEIRGATAA